MATSSCRGTPPQEGVADFVDLSYDHLLSWNTVMWWITMEESTKLIKVSLPTLFRSLPFHREALPLPCR
jgi:hypothetical protein